MTEYKAKYTQTFTLIYDADPDTVWQGLQKAVDAIDGAKLETVHADDKKLGFSTGITSTSWGQELDARVEARSQGGTQIHVRGTPKGTFLATTWGEKLHTFTVKRRMKKALAAIDAG